MKKRKKISKKNEKKRWLYVTITLAVLGLSLLSYGIYAANPSTQTLTGENEVNSFELDIKPFENKANIKSLSPSIYQVSDFDPDAIDQIQNSFPGGLNQYIGTLLNVNLLYRQTGLNEREPWNGFEIIIARHGMPTEPLYIGIRDDISYGLDPITGNYDFLAYIDASGLPNEDTFYWVGSDYQISGITANDAWAIILISFNDGSFDDYWMWACSDQSPYTMGEGQFWSGIEWKTSHNGVLDLCFRTYTIPGLAPEEPVISIAITSSIVSSFFGILSLLGAAFSSYKYFAIALV